MNTGLWVLLWVIALLVIIGILLWAANRKPVEVDGTPFEVNHPQIDTGIAFEPKDYTNYFPRIYPVTGEYPKPLTGIQKEAEAKRAIKEFAAGSTAAPKMAHISELADWPTSDMESLPVSDVSPDSIMVTASVSNSKPFFAEKLKKDARLPSVKSKTPVAKKAPAKKADKPVAKKRATKKATNKA